MSSEQHRDFQERLGGSRHALFVIAEMLHERGYHVEIPPIRTAPTAADAPGYFDDGDSFFFIKNRVEVKHLKSTPFTDHYWPHKHAFVSGVASVERADQAKDMFAYVLLSQDCRYLGWIDYRTTRKSWYKEKYWMSNTGNVEIKYCCPLDLIRFVALANFDEIPRYAPEEPL